MRICPLCGTTYPNNAPRCCAGDRSCRAYTVELTFEQVEAEKEIRPELIEDEIEIVQVEPEPKEDKDGIIGRAGEIIDLITAQGPMTYNQIGDALGLSYKRVVRLVSQMVRDGIDLKREGKPRKVSL